MYLIVGFVGRPVGLKGEVEVEVVSDDPIRFAVGSTVIESGPDRPLNIRSVRRNRHGTVIGFEEVTDREAAEALRGSELVVRVGDARPLGPQEYWDHDLIGCAVTTTDGRDLGHVTDVLHTPANDVLVVTGPAGEHLIALVADAIESIEPGSRITVTTAGLSEE